MLQIEIYEKLKAKFTVDDQRHYMCSIFIFLKLYLYFSYNPRDVTEWAFGMLRYDMQRNNL